METSINNKMSNPNICDYFFDSFQFNKSVVIGITVYIGNYIYKKKNAYPPDFGAVSIREFDDARSELLKEFWRYLGAA